MTITIDLKPEVEASLARLRDSMSVQDQQLMFGENGLRMSAAQPSPH